MSAKSELEKTKKKRKCINLRWEEVTGQSQTLGPKLEPKLRKNDNLERWDLGKKGVEEGLVVARSEKGAEKEGTKNGGENRDGVAKKRKIFEGNFKTMNTTATSTGNNEKLKLMSENDCRNPWRQNPKLGRTGMDGDGMKGS